MALLVSIGAVVAWLGVHALKGASLDFLADTAMSWFARAPVSLPRGFRAPRAKRRLECNSSMGFIHQQKSAGSTLRTAMQRIAAAHGVVWERKVQRDGRCACGSRDRAVWSFSDEAPRCDACPSLPWLTMVREPWDRMRSAYMYCATTGDALCYMPDYQPRRAPCDFGRRWGNYQFAKLAALPFSWRPPCARLREPVCACLDSSTSTPGQ